MSCSVVSSRQRCPACSRRGRDLGIVVTTLVALSFQLLNPLLQHVTRGYGGARAAAADLAAPFRWTPPGLLASTPLLVQQGRPLLALLRIALVAGWLSPVSSCGSA